MAKSLIAPKVDSRVRNVTLGLKKQLSDAVLLL